MAIQRRVTVDEFERILRLPENRERLLELIEGEIVEKMPTEKHGEVALAIGGPLRAYVKQHGLGRVGVEIRHQLPADKDNSRLPDVSFIVGNRPSVEQGGVPRMPDLAIEIKSPDDSLRELREKAHYYLANGSRLVWVMDYTKRLVIVITADEEYIFVAGDPLTGGDVLPGFSISVAEIFEDTTEHD